MLLLFPVTIKIKLHRMLVLHETKSRLNLWLFSIDCNTSRQNIYQETSILCENKHFMMFLYLFILILEQGVILASLYLTLNIFHILF